MKILVTGGAGYIGSHTCVELLEAGHEIIVLDDFSNSKPKAIERIKTITGKELKLAIRLNALSIPITVSANAALIQSIH